MAAANAEATRALGMDMYFYVINLWADPRFGRQEEGFSVRAIPPLCFAEAQSILNLWRCGQEEPTLTAAYVTATINGSHDSLDLAPDGYMPDGRVAAMFKHCCGYGAAAGGLVLNF